VKWLIYPPGISPMTSFPVPTRVGNTTKVLHFNHLP
jgi:hypothetical protein